MSNLATWFNPSLQVMQRAKGRSAVAAAAYRSCTFLHDERVDIQHDYRKKAVMFPPSYLAWKVLN